jgi:hypothetical protein
VSALMPYIPVAFDFKADGVATVLTANLITGPWLISPGDNFVSSEFKLSTPLPTSLDIVLIQGPSGPLAETPTVVITASAIRFTFPTAPPAGLYQIIGNLNYE